MNLAKSLTLLFVALSCASAAFAQTPAPVRTQSGLVQGTVVDGVRVYKGIPFAAPT